MDIDPNLKTVLFVDICGSTANYEKLGDIKAHDLISQTLAVMQAQVEAMGGWVIKTIGDEIMACFWHPLFALDAAKAINFHLSLQQTPSGMPEVAVHSGLEHGEVVEQGGDLYGDAVNIAARLSSLAKPWQILTTQKTIEALGSENDEAVRRVIHTNLRGKAEELDIFEVLWEEDGLTRCAEKPAPALPETRLMLKHGDRQLEVSSQHPVATMGRGAHNDLVISEKVVSRWHARVELRRDKFFLVDKSTNGTFLMTDGNQPVFLNYEQSPLPAGGIIVLGSDDELGPDVTVRFEIT